MFSVLSVNGMKIVFKRHDNGRWQLTGYKGDESFELSRSTSPEALPAVLNALVAQPDEDNPDFKQACRKIKKKIRQASII